MPITNNHFSWKDKLIGRKRTAVEVLYAWCTCSLVALHRLKKFCYQLKNKPVILLRFAATLEEFWGVCTCIYVCLLKHVCTYILVLFPTFCPERTANVLMNATAIVWLYWDFIPIFYFGFYQAVDAKIITNSILHQTLLIFYCWYLAILLASGPTFRQMIHFYGKYRLFYFRHFPGTSSALTLKNKPVLLITCSDNFFILFRSRTDNTPIHTGCKVTA